MSAVRSLFGPCWLGLRNRGIRPHVPTDARRDHLRAAQLEEHRAMNTPWMSRDSASPRTGARFWMQPPSLGRERVGSRPAPPDWPRMALTQLSPQTVPTEVPSAESVTK